ncbi:MAG: hypothetical protein ABSH37_15545 [Bryobacteraceae bacterium]
MVTQAATLDELAFNIREAIDLPIEGEDLSELGFSGDPTILATIELSRALLTFEQIPRPSAPDLQKTICIWNVFCYSGIALVDIDTARGIWRQPHKAF